MYFLWYFQEHNQTSENIFRNFFWNATKYMKIFFFPENNISGKYLISGNAFTRTKHSLRYKRRQELFVVVVLLYAPLLLFSVSPLLLFFYLYKLSKGLYPIYFFFHFSLFFLQSSFFHSKRLYFSNLPPIKNSNL